VPLPSSVERLATATENSHMADCGMAITA